MNGELAAGKHIWVAGDLASYYSEALGSRRTSQGATEARWGGELAARNMLAGEGLPPQRYDWWPTYEAQVGPHRLATYGAWSPTPEPGTALVAVWAPEEGQGMWYRVREGKVVGLLTWGLQVDDAAFRCLKVGRTYDLAQDLVRAVPFLPEPLPELREDQA